MGVCRGRMANAWRRKTVRGAFHRDADAGRRRLNRVHGFLGKKRWDDPLQKHTDVEVEEAWQLVAQDLELVSPRKAISDPNASQNSPGEKVRNSHMMAD